MKYWIVSLFIALSSLGFSQIQDDNVIGEWEVTSAVELDGQKVNSEPFVMIFHENGTLDVGAESRHAYGHWKLDKGIISFETKMKGTTGSESGEIVIKSFTSDRMEGEMKVEGDIIVKLIFTRME